MPNGLDCRSSGSAPLLPRTCEGSAECMVACTPLSLRSTNIVELADLKRSKIVQDPAGKIG